ncbi:Protein of unknown function [Gryllus bimaculatus]|nr:Protein of unknown function [Gryllus bimaculatus]
MADLTSLSITHVLCEMLGGLAPQRSGERSSSSSSRAAEEEEEATLSSAARTAASATASVDHHPRGGPGQRPLRKETSYGGWFFITQNSASV